MVNVIKQFLHETIQKARDNNMSFEELEQTIVENEAIFQDAELFSDDCKRLPFGAEKLFLGVTSPKTYEYLIKLYTDYIKGTFDGADVCQSNSVRYLIFDFTDIGYLVTQGMGEENFVFWYPYEYQYVSRRISLDNSEGVKFELEVIETENFMTPFFILRSDQIPRYCVKMAQRGYSLMYDFENIDLGCDLASSEHSNDFFKVI